MNGVKNDLKHTYGVLQHGAEHACLTRPGSQFFIMTSDSPHLDGAYAAFGKVLEGMEVAEDIVNTRRDYNDRPMTPPGDEVRSCGDLRRGLSLRADVKHTSAGGTGALPVSSALFSLI